MELDPTEDIPGEPARMGACLANLTPAGGFCPGFGLPAKLVKPLAELESQQFAEERPDADTGIKVSSPADLVLFRLIISINWTIKG